MSRPASVSPSIRILAAVSFIVYLAGLTWFFVVKDPAVFMERMHAFSWQHTGQFVNLVPGRTILYYITLQENAGTGLRQIGGNLGGFLPFGFLLPLAFKRARTIGACTALAASLSALFEIFQYCTNVGSFDVDDLILNVSGAVCGFFLLRFAAKTLIRAGRGL